MAVSVEAGAHFSAGVPKPLFPVRLQAGIRRNDFLVSRDGRRFLLLSPLGKERTAPMVVVLHWPAALKE
jgi:poly(3-hydroxybutyrate) depolymerase